MAFTPQQNEYNLKSFYTNIMKENALLYKYQFIVEFIGLDEYGITDQTDASKNLTYYVKSANVPGFDLLTAKTTFLGTEFRTPGVLKYGQNWTVKVLLNQDLFAYKGLQIWRRAISRLEIDGGGIKIIPNVQARISLLSPDHQTCVNSYILEGVWIKKLGKMDFKYGTNGGENPLELDCEFRYQYSYPDPDFNLNDPLGSTAKK